MEECGLMAQNKMLQWLKMTQLTSSGAVTAVTNCRANYVETSQPSNDLPFFAKQFTKLSNMQHTRQTDPLTEHHHISGPRGNK